MTACRIEHYLTAGGQKDLYIDWLGYLRDGKAKVATILHVVRIEQGNFGDHKFCRDGVWELRIDIWPSYRVYYAQSGQRLVLLFAVATSACRHEHRPYGGLLAGLVTENRRNEKQNLWRSDGRVVSRRFRACARRHQRHP